ncbi:MAG: Stp1/IreP family PP2C-type Ser/Thr phosphatase [Elusimicrobia bacterium]|nr:Stp1/IreP family PP2C-type Ser/Thr phosphatase [Elusimicrobiota bacterium]
MSAILEMSGATDPGCVRPNNEDSFTVKQELGLMIVADGMGGHSAGEVASAMAVSSIEESVRRQAALAAAKDLAVAAEGQAAGASELPRMLESFVARANREIYDKGRAMAAEGGMGTTVVAVLADPSSLCVAHVGDSRLYLYREGKLLLLTGDHSLVAEHVRSGLLTPEEASRSSLQNILTRALGAEPHVQVDVAEHALYPGDLLLLATDGLTKMVCDDEIRGTLSESASPRKIAARLIEKARLAGGDDNITVVAARVVFQRRSGLKNFVASLWEH